jgi:hypothetical protein
VHLQPSWAADQILAAVCPSVAMAFRRSTRDHADLVSDAYLASFGICLIRDPNNFFCNKLFCARYCISNYFGLGQR